MCDLYTPGEQTSPLTRVPACPAQRASASAVRAPRLVRLPVPRADPADRGNAGSAGPRTTGRGARVFLIELFLAHNLWRIAPLLEKLCIPVHIYCHSHLCAPVDSAFIVCVHLPMCVPISCSLRRHDRPRTRYRLVIGAQLLSAGACMIHELCRNHAGERCLINLHIPN